MATAARDNQELHILSVETVRIICRFARNIIRRSILVDRTNGSWATTIVGVSTERVQAILDAFHQSQVSSLNLSRVFMSSRLKDKIIEYCSHATT